MILEIVCISDTHNKEPSLPSGDVLLHSGDLTFHGTEQETLAQIKWLGSQRSRYQDVIVVPGNHDFFIEQNFSKVEKLFKDLGITLLHNRAATLSSGIQVWGSGHTPIYQKWAFMLPQDQLAKVWEQIPQDTDILITHCPPAGILDKIASNLGIGCVSLADKLKKITPKLHLFGHAHESHGTAQTTKTLFVNAAITPVLVIQDF
jgi:Icc-related predicted phosphoesterase